MDATANPYLALGAIIAAGLDGINRQLHLCDPIQVDPAILTEEKRQSQNINRLPINLEQAITILEKDQVILTALGKDLATSFLAVRRKEWEFMKDWNLEQEVKLLLERY